MRVLTHLSLEHIYLGEMVADMRIRRRQAAPGGRLLEHPRNFLAHRRFEIDRVAREMRRHVGPIIERLIVERVEPLDQRLTHGVGILKDVWQCHGAREVVSLRLAEAHANAMRNKRPTPLPAWLINHLWDSPYEGLGRPVLRSSDVPQVEGKQVGIRQDTGDQLVSCEIGGDIMQDGIHGGKLPLQQGYRAHGMTRFRFASQFRDATLPVRCGKYIIRGSERMFPQQNC